MCVCTRHHGPPHLAHPAANVGVVAVIQGQVQPIAGLIQALGAEGGSKAEGARQ